MREDYLTLFRAKQAQHFPAGRRSLFFRRSAPEKHAARQKKARGERAFLPIYICFLQLDGHQHGAILHRGGLFGQHELVDVRALGHGEPFAVLAGRFPADDVLHVRAEHDRFQRHGVAVEQLVRFAGDHDLKLGAEFFFGGFFDDFFGFFDFFDDFFLGGRFSRFGFFDLLDGFFFSNFLFDDFFGFFEGFFFDDFFSFFEGFFFGDLIFEDFFESFFFEDFFFNDFLLDFDDFHFPREDFFGFLGERGNDRHGGERGGQNQRHHFLHHVFHWDFLLYFAGSVRCVPVVYEVYSNIRGLHEQLHFKVLARNFSCFCNFLEFFRAFTGENHPCNCNVIFQLILHSFSPRVRER